MGKEGVKIEIMDTTPCATASRRAGYLCVPHEKMMIARLLLEDLQVASCV